MAYDGLKALSVNNFAGLNTLQNATDVPQYVSPDCQNVEFVPGRVQKRPGTSNAFKSPNNLSKINYTKSYVMLNGDTRNLAVDDSGNLFYEDVTNAPGTTVSVMSGFLDSISPNSTTLFGKEWIAFGDGQQGQDIPRQYDGTNVYRVSQGGPGQSPVVVDEGSYSISSAAGSATQGTSHTILSIVETGNLVEVQAGYTAEVGESVVISGVSPSGYNGTWTITEVNGSNIYYVNPTSGLISGTGGSLISQLAVFKTTLLYGPNVGLVSIGENVTVSGVTNAAYNGTWPVISSGRYGTFPNYYLSISVNLNVTGTASSANGTFFVVGNIVAGVHQVTLQFLLSTDYLTPPSPPFTWIAAGGKRAVVSNIAIGPANVLARYVSFTPISSGQFYYVASNPSDPNGVTIINDNTSTTAYMDFLDTDLLDGTNINDAFDLIELGESIGFLDYNSRLVTWGMTNRTQNFNNLGFDGGFSQDGNSIPLGWTADATNYTGGGKALVSVTGDAYAITGDGIHATQGKIAQSAFQDYLGDPILFPSTAYTISARVSKSAILTGATLYIQLFSSSAAYVNGITINIGTQVNTNSFQRFTAGCPALPSVVPSDLEVLVYATNLTSGNSVYVDEIELYPTGNPVETSVIRFSNEENPESFQGLTGFAQPSQENGQAIRNCFVLRDFFYITKERSLFVTRDDGQNEPAGWEINEVSSKIGTPSPRGVGIGDEWAVIASESGLWFFTGGQLSDQSKLSLEIQPTWDSINWNLGQLIDVKVDTRRKRIYVNCPIGPSATQNNTVLTLDYTEGFGDPQQNGGIGRKWCPWTLAANAINLCLQQDQSIILYVGNNFGSGWIYKLDSSNYNDYGSSLTPIDAYWQSGYFQNTSRLNYAYLIANVVGIGLLQMILRTGDQSSFYPIRGWILNALGLKNMERQIQKQHFRMAVRFEVTDLNAYFSIQGFTLMVNQAIFAPVRGINS